MICLVDDPWLQILSSKNIKVSFEVVQLWCIFKKLNLNYNPQCYISPPSSPHPSYFLTSLSYDRIEMVLLCIWMMLKYLFRKLVVLLLNRMDFLCFPLRVFMMLLRCCFPLFTKSWKFTLCRVRFSVRSHFPVCLWIHS